MSLNRNQAITTSLLNRVQEAEDAFWTLLSSISIGNATGDLLRKLGKLVGEGQQGRSDGDYQAAIRLQIRVLRSRGRATDIIDVSVLAAINSVPRYSEYYPAGFWVDIDNLPAGGQVAPKLGHTKAAGTYGNLVFSPDATHFLSWSHTSGATSQQVWADSVSGTPDNKWRCALPAAP